MPFRPKRYITGHFICWPPVIHVKMSDCVAINFYTMAMSESYENVRLLMVVAPERDWPPPRALNHAYYQLGTFPILDSQTFQHRRTFLFDSHN